MTDEERAAANKAAVDAMKNAKANMGTVLERVDTLERALRVAGQNIASLKSYVAPGAYTYPISGNSKKAVDLFDDAVAAINKVL